MCTWDNSLPYILIYELQQIGSVKRYAVYSN